MTVLHLTFDSFCFLFFVSWIGYDPPTWYPKQAETKCYLTQFKILFFLFCFDVLFICLQHYLARFQCKYFIYPLFLVLLHSFDYFCLSPFLLPCHLSSALPRPSPLSFTISLGLPRCLRLDGFKALQRHVRVLLYVCVCVHSHAFCMQCFWVCVHLCICVCACVPGHACVCLCLQTFSLFCLAL